MEITLTRRTLTIALALAFLLLLVCVATVGEAFTPVPPRVIARADWEARKMQRRYHKELTQLRQDVAELVDILEGRPDPVRAEMAASRLSQQHADGLDLLAGQRDAVVHAAQMVRDWAAGYASRAEAVEAVNGAMRVLPEEAVWEPGEDAPRERAAPAAVTSEEAPAAGWWTEYHLDGGSRENIREIEEPNGNGLEPRANQR